MDDLLEPFEYLTDATDKIDQLIEEAESATTRKEKQAKLTEARALIEAVEKRCGRSMYKEKLL